jgi:N-acetylmuramoyl-L-alanine amidase
MLAVCMTMMLAGCSDAGSGTGTKSQNEDTTDQASQTSGVQETDITASLRTVMCQRNTAYVNALEQSQKDIQESLQAKIEEWKAEAEPAGVIVLDAGHSGVVAGGSEPIGPGASEYKAADASGTSGISSGVKEYELTLNIAQQLKTELETRGYTVIMTRESNDIPMSCVERAEVANQAQADAYIRIHANGSDDSSAQGAMTICTTPDSPYVSEMYTINRTLADCIINKYCEVTGCENDGVWETDTMSGNNWSQVPVTLLEMGYMTNPEEDLLMETEEYQSKIIQGIADGIDSFMESQTSEQ